MTGRARERKLKRREWKRKQQVLRDELAKSEQKNKGRNDLTSADDMTLQALQSQGKHEADIHFPLHREGGLQTSFVMCSKNEKHEGFTPVTELSIGKIPQPYQDRDVLECLRCLVSLAVKVKVPYTSENRPAGYDFWEQRGKFAATHTRYGSGSVFVPKKRPKGHRCPCKICKHSARPSSKWFFVWVSTAQHVIFDDLEAKETEVEMFFDDSNDTSGIRKLQGLHLVNWDQQSDRCILECVTHDSEIYKSIKSFRGLLRKMEKKLNEKYSNDVTEKGQPLLAVVVSHPHGTAKQISFGTLIIKRHVKPNCPKVEWTEYLYDAATCNGSSGALVWLLGQERVGYRDRLITTHTHSGHHNGGLNKSGSGLDFITQKVPTTNTQLLKPHL